MKSSRHLLLKNFFKVFIGRRFLKLEDAVAAFKSLKNAVGVHLSA